MGTEMNDAVVIFPNQLFDIHPALAKNRKVFLLEEKRFFSAFRFHKKKLVLHRASMQAYRDRLTSKGYAVHYIEHQGDDTIALFMEQLRKHKIDTIHHADITDHELNRRFQKTLRKHDKRIEVLQTPNYLTSAAWLSEFFKGAAHYSLTHFYIAQRKRLQILVEADKPIGGKWSFDPANRKKIPRGIVIPEVAFPPLNKYVTEAMSYVSEKFPDNPGSVDNFIYPVTHEDADRSLHEFFQKRFLYFGDYQDAMRKDHPFLFHSLLSPSMNIGLLDPHAVVKGALHYAKEYRIPLHTVEGFIRQIIGWREFIRALYLFEYKRQRKTNFWNHHKKMPSSFYTGTTGIEPVDTAIARLIKFSYLHHIERLMILGNFMLVAEIDPEEIYRWFMELFIDSYDWVMVPNVYGLSQYADGGLMSTKPYFSSSHYIRKMSDYPKGRWCDIWDALYWTFIHKHRSFFIKNPRLSIMVRQIEKMHKGTLRQHIANTKMYLDHMQ